MKTWVTKFDEELLAKSKVYLAAAEAHPESCALLEKFGFTAEERARGHRLIENTERSFAWEREGRAWNFLGLTRERREQEARDWYKDTRERFVAECLRRAEEDSGWVGYGPATQWPLGRKLTTGTVILVKNSAKAFSVKALLDHRAEMRKNLALAASERPADAPPPKDTALVELAGWYERWKLLAQRVFRQRGDLMAPPRLRSRVAQAKYGEKAAGSLPVISSNAGPANNDVADDADLSEDAARGAMAEA